MLYLIAERRCAEMYTDYAPPVTDMFGNWYASHPLTPKNYKGHGVVVVEGGEKAKEIIALARDNGLTTRDADGDEIFWIVFESEPHLVRDFTGKSLRKTIWSNRYPRVR